MPLCLSIYSALEEKLALGSEAMGDYADVNGVHMFFEVSGDGEPLVLLHGGFGGIHVWSAQEPEMAERYGCSFQSSGVGGTLRT